MRAIGAMGLRSEGPSAAPPLCPAGHHVTIWSHMTELTENDAVWRALADPTRRRLLDALRAEPRTTGSLCAESPLTRFAVMKHLKVLCAAGLVVVEKRGRERLHHLNAAPIAAIRKRWMRPFAETAADRVLALKTLAEGERPMSDYLTRTNVVEVTVEAPAERVWSALTERIGDWWLKDFHTAEGSRMLLELEVGGRMWEDHGDGQGLQWATVIAFERGRRLELSGVLTADFGGPGHTLQKFTLEASGDATVVRLTDTVFGAIAKSTADSLESGWQSLLTDGLKKFVEAA